LIYFFAQVSQNDKPIGGVSGVAPGYPNNRRLLPILGLGRIGTLGIHPGEQAVQGGDLSDDLFVFGALKPERQLIHAPFDLGARELLRQNKLDRHRRCISQHRAEGQDQKSSVELLRPDFFAFCFVQPHGRFSIRLHNFMLASAALSRSLAAEAICVWTRLPKPQSVPTMMFSRSTISANVMIRSATSSRMLDEFRGEFASITVSQRPAEHRR